jgi:Membrane protein involved in the export of O-antigen and teichoic acid
MNRSRVYARNLLANWGGHGASMVVLFFLSPFVVHTLGSVEYGIWSLLNVLTGYLGIFDLGVRASTGRHIILYLGRGDHEKVDQTIRTGLGFFTVIGLVILTVGAGIGWVFPSVFSSVPEKYHALVKILLPAMAFNVWLTTFAAIFSSVLAAHDRFDIARGADVVVLMVRTIGTIFVLKQGWGITGLTGVVIVSTIIALLGNGFLSKRVYSRLQIWPLLLERDRVRELLGYGIAAFASTIAVTVIGQTDLVIVGSLINVQAVTVYSVGAMLIFYSSTFIDQIGYTFFPPVQRAAARGELDPVKWLFFRQVRLALIFGVPMYIGFMVFAEPFIRLWMLGPGFPKSSVEKAALVMLILAASKLFYLFTLGSRELLAAIGYIRFNAGIAVTEALFNLGLSLFFVMFLDWGLLGVAAGTLTARILVRTFALPWYACRKAGLSWKGFLVKIGLTGALSMLAFGGWCLLIRQVIPDGSWPMFCLQVVLALAGYAPIALLILVPTDDRERILRFLKIRRTLEIKN